MMEKSWRGIENQTEIPLVRFRMFLMRPSQSVCAEVDGEHELQ